MLEEEETFAERYASVLPPWLLNKCASTGFIHPTRIQRAALDELLVKKERNVIVQAETGSGKTLAYLLPTLASIDSSRAAVQAMIVVPTRELGMQVAGIAKRLAASAAAVETDVYEDKDVVAAVDIIDTRNTKKNKIMVMSVLQGSQNRRQRAWAWAEPPHVVIGTPQELCKMIKLAGIKRYNSIKTLVVDEVDACLLGNSESLSFGTSSSNTLHEFLSKYLSPTYEDTSSAAISQLNDPLLQSGGGPNANTGRPVLKTRQTIFCSATIPQRRHFCKQCVQNQWMLEEPLYISLQPGEQFTPATLQHGYIVCASRDEKFTAFRRVLGKIIKSSMTGLKKVLVFAQSDRPLERWAEQLAAGHKGAMFWKESYKHPQEQGAVAIYSVLRYDGSLSQRAAAMNAFRGGGDGSGEPGEGPRLRVMFSTDLAARGLDIVDTTHIINVDLPSTADMYVHRAGRTGRLGRPGQVLSIIAPQEEFVLKRLANKLYIDIKCIGRQQQKPKETKARVDAGEL